MMTQFEKQLIAQLERLTKAVSEVKDALDEMNGYLPTEQKEEPLAKDEFSTEDDLPFL